MTDKNTSTTTTYRVLDYRAGLKVRYLLAAWCEREDSTKQDAVEEAVRAFLDRWDAAASAEITPSFPLVLSSRSGTSYRIKLPQDLFERISICSDVTGIARNRLIESALGAWLRSKLGDEWVDPAQVEEEVEVYVSLSRAQVLELDRLSRDRQLARGAVLVALILEHIDALEDWFAEHPRALASDFVYTTELFVEDTSHRLLFRLPILAHVRMEAIAVRDGVELDDAYNAALQAVLGRSYEP